LPDVVGDDKHKHTPGTFADHHVTLEPGTRLAELLGDRAPVKSHHHQGIGRVGEGLRVAAHAEDGTIEAVEDPSHRFALGCSGIPRPGRTSACSRSSSARRASGSGSQRVGSKPNVSTRSLRASSAAAARVSLYVQTGLLLRAVQPLDLERLGRVVLHVLHRRSPRLEEVRALAELLRCWKTLMERDVVDVVDGLFRRDWA
jgi:hypothetical protein